MQSVLRLHLIVIKKARKLPFLVRDLLLQPCGFVAHDFPSQLSGGHPRRQVLPIMPGHVPGMGCNALESRALGQSFGNGAIAGASFDKIAPLATHRCRVVVLPIAGFIVICQNASLFPERAAQVFLIGDFHSALPIIRPIRMKQRMVKTASRRSSLIERIMIPLS